MAVLLITIIISSAHAEGMGLSVHAASGDFIKIRRGSSDVEMQPFAPKRHRVTSAQSQPFSTQTLRRVRQVIQEQKNSTSATLKQGASERVIAKAPIALVPATPIVRENVVKVISPFRRQGAEQQQMAEKKSAQPKQTALRKDMSGQEVKRIAINTHNDSASVEGDVDTVFYTAISQPNKDQKKFYAIMRDKGLVKKIDIRSSERRVASKNTSTDERFLRINSNALSLVGSEHGKKNLEIKFEPIHTVARNAADSGVVWPVKMSERQYVSSVFGRRVNPVTGRRSFHEGIDIAAPKGTEVLAVMDGVVSLTQNHRTLGRYVRIEHPDGSFSLYGHLSRWRVEDGQVVRAGEVIGNVGSTGRSTGSHVHFAFHVNDKPVDPLKYLDIPTEVAERSSEKTVAMR